MEIKMKYIHGLAPNYPSEKLFDFYNFQFDLYKV